MKGISKENMWLIILGVLLMVLLIVLAVVYIPKFYKVNNDNEQIANSGEVQEELDVIHIDSGDCLSEIDINLLFDLGEYKANEKMVYKSQDDKHFIEVWKVKAKNQEEAQALTDILQKRYEQIMNEYSNNFEMIGKIGSQDSYIMNIGGDVVTLIISDDAKQVNEITKKWLKK